MNSASTPWSLPFAKLSHHSFGAVAPGELAGVRTDFNIYILFFGFRFLRRFSLRLGLLCLWLISPDWRLVVVLCRRVLGWFFWLGCTVVGWTVWIIVSQIGGLWFLIRILVFLLKLPFASLSSTSLGICFLGLSR